MPMKQCISTYYRAAAARARSLLTKATTPWLRERLAAEIARCEHMAEEIEREREPDRKRGENRAVPATSGTLHPGESSRQARLVARRGSRLLSSEHFSAEIT